MELPIYKLIINDDDESLGINFWSIVENPAIKTLGVAFAEQPKLELKLSVFNEEKRMAIGPLMIPDMPIRRVDPKTKQEFYVFMDAETIDKAMIKFYQKGFQNNVNLEHDKNQITDGVTLYQHFILNKDLGIRTPKGFETHPEGTSFGIFKINNNEAWDRVKSGQFGFSLEGTFLQQPTVVVTEEEVGAVLKAISKKQGK